VLTNFALAVIARISPSFPHNGREFVVTRPARIQRRPLKACATDVRKRYQTAPTMHADLALLQAGKFRQALAARRAASRPHYPDRTGHRSTVGAGGRRLFWRRQAARRAHELERQIAQQLYAADINRAMQFWKKGTLNAPWNCWNHTAPLHVPQTLNPLSRRNPMEANQPSTSSEDLRGFEWFYLWQLCHKDDALSTWRASTNGMPSSVFHRIPRYWRGSGYSGPLFLWTSPRGSLGSAHNYGGDKPDLVFSPDARTVAYGTPAGAIELWDLRSKASHGYAAGTNRSTYCLTFSSDGNLLAAVDTDSSSIGLWDVSSQRLLDSLRSDGAAIFIASPSRPTARFWPLDIATTSSPFGTLPPVRKSRTSKSPSALPVNWHFRPTTGLLLSSGSIPSWLYAMLTRENFPASSGDMKVKSTNVAFSSDGQMIATASDDTTVKLWDSRSRQLLATFKGHLDKATSVAFSPHGETVFSAAADGVIKQWATAKKLMPTC